ncbi:MAG: pyridoxamine 5'-phosphate oxidase family protein [archaeon]
MLKIPKRIVSLFEGKVVFLATTAHTNPNIICVFVNAVVGNKIIITDNLMSQTSANLKKNPKAAIAFYYSGKAFQLKGVVNYQTGGEVV